MYPHSTAVFSTLFFITGGRLLLQHKEDKMWRRVSKKLLWQDNAAEKGFWWRWGKNNLHLLHISPTCIHLKRHTCENRHLATKNKMKSYILKTRGLSIKNSYYLAVIFNDILRTIKAREWSLLWIDFVQCVQWAAKYKVWCAKAKNIIYIPTKLLFYFCLMRLIVI